MSIKGSRRFALVYVSVGEAVFRTLGCTHRQLNTAWMVSAYPAAGALSWTISLSRI